METMVVDDYTYHLIKYAYVTVGNKDYIGSSSSPDLKFAGELLEVAEDHEWLTPLTPIERAPVGDTFAIESGKNEYSRHYLEEQLKEEKWVESSTGRNNMIYSFLGKKINQELNLVPDVITERREVGNYFMFEFDNNSGVLQVTEIESNYDDKDVANEYCFTLKQGDKVVAISMAGLTVLKLLKFGIKVFLYDFDYQNDKKVSWLVSND